MLVITLGTQASASTWLYNAARLLLARAGRPSFGVAVDNGLDALDRIPLGARDVVIKAHCLDQRFIKFAAVSEAKLLVSTRDARDSVVSQRERFGCTLLQASIDISRAYATIRSLPRSLPTARFAYEDGFTGHPGTIAEIAQFLGIGVDGGAVAEIFQYLSPGNIRSRIAAWEEAMPLDDIQGHDPDTQWHSSHIGDGKVGKWQDRLDTESCRLVDGCLMTIATPLADGRTLTWPAQLFTCNDSPAEGPLVQLVSREGADFLSYGPYLCLPRGRWRAVASLRSAGARGVEIDTDIFLPWDDRSLVQRRVRCGDGDDPPIVMDFDHHDHYQPLEARLRRVAGSDGALLFSGWRLFWLGDLAD